MAKKMELTVVGMLHRLTISTLRKLSEALNENGELKCRLERDPENPHDANAVRVIVIEKPWAKAHAGLFIGYIKRESASVIAPVMDAGDWDFTHVRLWSVEAEHGTGQLVAKRKA